MKKILNLVPLAALFFVTPNAIAGEFFIGLAAGVSNFSGLNDACDDLIEDNRRIGGLPVGCNVTEDSDSTIGINAGYNFNRYFGVEVGHIDLGEYSATVSASRISVPVTAEADISYAGIVLTAPLSEKFSLSARLGGVNANATVSGAGSSLELEDETTGFVGASLDYRLTDNLSLQIRYDDLAEIDITSAGIRYHF